MSFSVLTWNIGNPSVERARRQADWLLDRPEDVLILTETKRSEGCESLERIFRDFHRYQVLFPRPDASEYGVMAVSRRPLRIIEDVSRSLSIPSRLLHFSVDLPDGPLQVLGTYVPSRDASDAKIERKRRFLEGLSGAVASPDDRRRILCGDFNVLERDHVPSYRFFQDWEYDFYDSALKQGFVDAFRFINRDAREYSWVGRTGDGYRYDHCMISNSLVSSLRACAYDHSPRLARLSDHSALTATFEPVDLPKHDSGG